MKWNDVSHDSRHDLDFLRFIEKKNCEIKNTGGGIQTFDVVSFTKASPIIL